MLTDRRMQAVARYLTALRDASDGAPTSNPDEFIKEIRSHMLDKVAYGGEAGGAGTRPWERFGHDVRSADAH